MNSFRVQFVGLLIQPRVVYDLIQSPAIFPVCRGEWTPPAPRGAGGFLQSLCLQCTGELVALGRWEAGSLGELGSW